MRNRRNGFTLVELLVVIGIIAVLIGILLPTLARARKTANDTRSMSNVRQLLMGYAFYIQENKGALPFGYPPASVNGVQTTAYDPVSKHDFITFPVASRYPWRLIKYVSNVWPIIHGHEEMPALTLPTDDASTAESKGYLLSIYPKYGINSVYLGGDADRGEGFGNGTTTTPVTGLSCAFRANEVHRASEIIVFADCHQSTAMSNGFPRLSPPRIGKFAWWSVVKGKTQSGFPNTIMGLPSGWFTDRIVTGFFDGHAEARLPQDLADMRNWCPKATTSDWGSLGEVKTQ